ncbi:MAG: hypothetical protein IJ607_01115 [Bacteroidaceae bacterium]|nr:hypothetical protein [Bacteroidaceae bacterium]
MIFQIDKIMQDVRICLDQNMTSDALLVSGDIDTLALDDIIRSKILEAVQRVHMDAPNYLLEGGHNFGDAVYWRELESGWVLLPPDFMRLVVFEMDDWEQAVYQAISTDDPEYEKQRSRFKGIRGTAQRPVCAIAIRPEGRVLEFYSCKSENAKVSRAVYIPYPKIDEYGGIDISERCYDAVVYTAAGLTLLSCGETERGNSFSGLAQTFLV